MRLPTIHGVIDRRILVNFRVDADVLREFLPRPFRPQLVEGFGIAGICLIRLKQARPKWLPRHFGVGSENAAHRIAVEWDLHGTTHTGVYIPRRDTSSWFNYVAGGRVFPGVHHHARFSVEETGDRYRVAVESPDDGAEIAVSGRIAQRLPATSVFRSVEEASRFFEQGSVGYSPCKNGVAYEGLELESFNWHVEPLEVEHVESSFLADESRFPAGSKTFDCALLMREIQHQWHARPTIAAA
ncbi:MAG: DUF2071 domain-containing protein [Pirellulales bacterium]|nr:DUF2071 domain-containing protein [Pirellulales bacterium]